MTPLTRSVPQRRRPSLLQAIAEAAIVAAVLCLLVVPIGLVAVAIMTPDPSPSRLQPVLDRTGVTGVVEVVR